MSQQPVGADRPVLPLSGVRVVALEQAVAAPLCTRHLADLGADVIKVERPGTGDFARHYDRVVAGESAYFVWLNRGKRSIALDLRREEEATVLERLLARADVFVHNLGPGAVERLGLGWEQVHERWPTLIVCGISGYGDSGPYRERKAFDLLLQGESGLIAVTGSPEEPAKVGISIADISAGMYALASILAALYERRESGEGRRIEIAMLDCLAEWMMAPVYHQLFGGSAPPRTGTRHNMIVPYGPYRTGDGRRVNLAVQNQAQWARFCRVVLERPDLIDDERFRTNALRVRHREELERLIEERFARASAREVEQRLEAADIPFGALNEVADLLRHPQLEARGRWFETATPGGPAPALAHPLNLAGMPLRQDGTPALDEHGDEIRGELGLPRREGQPRGPAEYGG